MMLKEVIAMADERRNVSREQLRDRLPEKTMQRSRDDADLTGTAPGELVSGTKDRMAKLVEYLDPRMGLRPYALGLLRQHLAARDEDGTALQAYALYEDFLKALDGAHVSIERRTLPDGLWSGLAEQYGLSVSTVRRRVALAEEVLLTEVRITLS